MILLLLSFLFSMPDRPADAPSAADSVFVLPEITVTATRTPVADTSAPARVFVLDSEDVTASGSASVADLLAARSTGFVRFYGSGGLATLSLRGAAPSQTLLLVDGQRLSDPQTGQIDLSLLPTVLLDDIEIVHGAGSALYGSDGVAGVINLRTRAFESGDSYTLRAGAGAFGEHAISGQFSRALGRWRTGVAAEAVRSDGDFAVAPDVARRANVRRDGADREQASLYASARRAGDLHHFTVSAWVAAAERGLPGPVTTPPIGERQWDRQYRLWASDRFAWGDSEVQFGGGTHAASIRYLNPQLEIDDTGTSTGYFIEGTLTAARGIARVTTGGTADYQLASHPSRRSAHVGHGAVFVAGAVGSNAAVLYPALRLDGYGAPASSFRAALSPKLGFSTAVPGMSRARMKASVGRTFRSPTMNERYWQPGGNPDLRPERGWHGDIGASYSLRAISAEISAFAAAMHDEILWLRTPAGYYAPRNLQRTRSLGVEMTGNYMVSLDARRHLNAGAVVTFTRASDRSDPSSRSFGSQLRYVPPIQVKGHLSLHVGPASVDLNSRYVGRRYVTTDGTQWVDPYLVVDLQMRLRQQVAGAAVSLAVSVENALDARYAVIQHYPMPPRHLRMSLTVNNHR